MKVKLDENLGHQAAQRLHTAGHDVATVSGQGLSGATDETVFGVCAGELRTLITLDFDFAQVLRFPPANTAGIAVLSAPGRMTSGLLDILLGQLVAALRDQPIDGRLWIVEPGRVRIHAAGAE
ncbi:MAG: DUF5615 family PIN-like protein [Betaproteobacteria bacterium]|nr:DUF5615 family PIN-like protein [Betaproteobacteria bacterium]